VFIKKLCLQKIRNLIEIELRFSSRLTIICGENGLGKTTVLEAISVLSHGSSFRTGSISELLTAGQNEGLISAEINNQDGDFELSVALNGARKKAFLNGKNVRSAKDFYGRFPAVEFTPDDLYLIKGTPAERRRFIDRTLTLIDQSYLQLLVDYDRARKSRNNILKTAQPKSIQQSLEPWDEILVKTGLQITNKREKFINDLKVAIDPAYSTLIEGYDDEHWERIKLDYKGDFVGKDQDQLIAIYREKLSLDVARQATTFGPHRDDLSCLLDTGRGELLAKEIASQGQTRTFALALKLAALKLIEQACGEQVVLLLDDVDSELDSVRSKALFNIIHNVHYQVILTTTNKNLQLINNSDVTLLEKLR
jgi:DNA replication and repair protein RecF